VKILLDMNLSPRWVAVLDAAGFAATHWSHIGRGNAPDVEVMNWARANDHIVFTNDLDFSALLAMTRSVGPSVLQIRLQDLMPDAVGDIVVRVLRDHEVALLKGAIVTIADNATRVRILPLKAEPA
jgi:predicted nuclease of predicted toxin-antitoxin system